MSKKYIFIGIAVIVILFFFLVAFQGLIEFLSIPTVVKMYIAAHHSDLSKCDAFEDDTYPEIGSLKDRCYRKYAIEKGDVTLCHQIPIYDDSEYEFANIARDECFEYFALASGNITLCDNILRVVSKGSCYGRIASYKDKVEICVNADSQIKATCYTKFIFNNGVEGCKAIVEGAERAVCMDPLRYKYDKKPETELPTIIERDVQDLLIYLPDGDVYPLYDDDPWVVRQHKIEVRIDLLKNESIDTVNLNLFDEFNYIVKKKSLEKCEDKPYFTDPNSCKYNAYFWYGEISPGREVDFYFDDNGTILGNIPVIPDSDRYAYRIRKAPKEEEQSIIITEIDASKFPPD